MRNFYPYISSNSSFSHFKNRFILIISRPFVKRRLCQMLISDANRRPSGQRTWRNT